MGKDYDAASTTAVGDLPKFPGSDFLAHHTPDAVDVYTDSKAAYDLCHRFTTAQNSRHVDRKMFKMRELRGAGVVKVNHMPGEANPETLHGTRPAGRS